MDDGGRCLLDVISDPLALEYFLGCSNEQLKSAAQNDGVTQLTSLQPKRPESLAPLTPQDSLLSSAESSPASVAAAPPYAPSATTTATRHVRSPCPLPPGQALPNHAPVPPPPSPAPSPFHAPAPSPAAPSPFSASSRSPMPPPPPSLSPSSMSASHSRSPSGGYPVATPSPGYQPVRSPAAASPHAPTSFAAVQLNKVLPSSAASGGAAAVAMAPATVNILQHHHHQQLQQQLHQQQHLQQQLHQQQQLQQQQHQQQLQHQQATIVSTMITMPTGAPPSVSSPAGTVNVSGQLMQIIQTAPQSQQQMQQMQATMQGVSTPGGPVRHLHHHHITNVKPIQPKQQQILPKPPAGSPAPPVTSHQQPTGARRGGNLISSGQSGAGGAGAQTSQTLVLGGGPGQGLPTGTMGAPQGTLLLNHINLGALGQNHHPILFPGGTSGMPQQLQLVMRPQQAFVPGKALSAGGPGQTAAVVIPGHQHPALGCATGPQQGGLRPANLMGGTRLVSGPGPGQLVLQQIQGPYTVIQTLQGAQVGAHALGNVIQGQAFQGTIPPGLVLNSHHQGVITSSGAAPTVAEHHHHHHQQQQQLVMAAQLQAATRHLATPPTPPPQQTITVKPQSVNLEELLKQAGIVPEDGPPSPTSIVSAAEQNQPMAAYAQVSSSVPVVNGPHTLIGQDHIPVSTSSGGAPSPLLAHLQQPITTSQLQSSVSPVQHQQLKFSMAQDGSLYLQRPVFQTPGGTLTLTQHHAQSQHQQLPVSIPVGGLSTTTTTTMTTVAGAAPSVLLQRLNAGMSSPQHHHLHHQQLHSHAQLVTTSPSPSEMGVTSPAQPSLLPVGLNVMQSAPVPTSSPAPVSVTSPSSANVILSSMLSQSHPMLAQSLGVCHDGPVAPAPPAPSITAVVGGPKGRAKVTKPRQRKIPVAANIANAAVNRGGGGRAPVKCVPASSVPASLSTACTTTPSSSSPVQQRGPPVADSVRANMAAAAAAAAAAANPTCSSSAASALPATPGVLVSGFPFAGLQPGQRVQTIQLTPQGQEALQKVQAQLRALGQVANRMPTPQQVQQIQQLHSEQQKILAQGKVISVQQQPYLTSPAPQQTAISAAQQQRLQPIASAAQPHQQSAPAPKYIQQKQLMGMSNHQTHGALTTAATPTTTQSQLNSITNTSSALVQNASGATQPVTQHQVATTIAISQAMLSAGSTSVKTMTAGTRHLKLVTLAPHRTAVQQVRPLNSEQQQQLLNQNQAKQALLLKLQQQQQHQNQQIQQQFQQQARQTSNASIQQQAAGNSQSVSHDMGMPALKFSNGVLQLQSTGTGAFVHKPTGVAQFPDNANRGIKRHATSPAVRSSRIHQKLMEDQSAVLNADTKTPFHSKQDACKRLLQYHVFSSRAPLVDELQRADEIFETFSEHLLEKARLMMTKYRMLLLKESMKENTTAEQVMLDRMFMQDETQSLERDRRTVKEGKDLELPPPPEHWLVKVEVDDELVTLEESTGGGGADQCLSVKREEEDEVDDEGCGTPANDSGVSVSTDVKREPPSPSPDDTAPTPQFSLCPLPTRRTERAKNYDEWAEIQRELEMYPLDDGEEVGGVPSHHGAGSPEGHMGDYECSATLSDFEPPVPKVIRAVHQSVASSRRENCLQSDHASSPAATYGQVNVVERLVPTPPPPTPPQQQSLGHGGLNLFAPNRRLQQQLVPVAKVPLPRNEWDRGSVPTPINQFETSGVRESSSSEAGDDEPRECLTPAHDEWDGHPVSDSCDDGGEFVEGGSCANSANAAVLGCLGDDARNIGSPPLLAVDPMRTTNQEQQQENHFQQHHPTAPVPGQDNCDDESSNVTSVEELFNVTFRSWPPELAMDGPPPNGALEGLLAAPMGDDDLNAQVQNAINSILNLQSLDDTCGDLFAAANAAGAVMSQHHQLALSEGAELLLALGGGDGDHCTNGVEAEDVEESGVAGGGGGDGSGGGIGVGGGGEFAGGEESYRPTESNYDQCGPPDRPAVTTEVAMVGQQTEEVEDMDSSDLIEDEEERTEEPEVEDASVQCELGENELDFRQFDGNLSRLRHPVDEDEFADDVDQLDGCEAVGVGEAEDGSVDEEGMDYEAETIVAPSNLDESYASAEGGPSEIDAALDEAVKSILL